MDTTTISVDEGGTSVVLVNVFTVDPGRQVELLNALEVATNSIFVHVPGFVSANLHSSLDGHRVINYAQWSDVEAYQGALRRTDVREHLATAADIAEAYDPSLVTVRFVTTAAGHAAVGHAAAGHAA